eukprot:PhF_6_TR8440/c0_g1_i2/m.13162
MWWVTYWSEAAMVPAAYLAQRGGSTSSPATSFLTIIGCCVTGPTSLWCLWFGAVYLSCRRGGKIDQKTDHLARSICGAQYDIGVKVVLSRHWAVVLGPLEHLVFAFITTSPVGTSSVQGCYGIGVAIVCIHACVGLVYGVVRPFVFDMDNVVPFVCSTLSSVSVLVGMVGNPEEGVAIVLVQTCIRILYSVFKVWILLGKRKANSVLNAL